MKKRRLAAILATALFLVFATGALAAMPGPLRVKIESLSIAVGGRTLVTSTGGAPPYEVTSSRTDVAPLSCDKQARTCWATGQAAGVTTIVVRDSMGDTYKANLTVTKSAPKPKPISEQINQESLQKQDATQKPAAQSLTR